MKRCPAIHMPVANATSIAALAHCISHSRELVTNVDQFEIFAVGDFARIKYSRGKNINRKEEHP